MAFGDADASTPPFAQVNTNFTTTGAQCSAFTPPADSLVRLAVFADTSAAANPGNETVTDTLAGATGWVFKGRRSKPDSGAQAGSVALWEKYYATSPGAIQVTVVGNATGAASGGFSTKVVAGCTGTAGFVEGSNTAAVMSIVETTVNANVRVEMAGTDWNVAAAPTAGTGQTAVLSSAVGTGPDTRVYVGIQNAVTAVAGTAVNSSTGSPSGGNANNFISWELVPSAGGGGATATPTTVHGVGEFPAATISAGTTLAPATVSGVGHLPAPTVAATTAVSPTVVSGVGEFPAATVSAGSTLAPVTVHGVGEFPAATVGAGAGAAPATVSGVGEFPAATVSAGATLAPTTVHGVGEFPAATPAAGSTAAPATVSGVGSLPAPSVAAGGSATATPDVVHGVGELPAPGVAAGGGATATPGTLSGVGELPPPTVTAATVVSAVIVSGVGHLPAPAVSASAGATAAPGTLSGRGSIGTPAVSTGGIPPPPQLIHIAVTPLVHVTEPPLQHVAASPFMHVT